MTKKFYYQIRKIPKKRLKGLALKLNFKNGIEDINDGLESIGYDIISKLSSKNDILVLGHELGPNEANVISAANYYIFNLTDISSYHEEALKFNHEKDIDGALTKLLIAAAVEGQLFPNKRGPLN